MPRIGSRCGAISRNSCGTPARGDVPAPLVADSEQHHSHHLPLPVVPTLGQGVERAGFTPLATSSTQHERLAEVLGLDIRAAPARRHGRPSIASGPEALRRVRARRILVLLVYPRHAGTTTANAFDTVTAEIRRWQLDGLMRFGNQYHDDAGYIQALADSVHAFRMPTAVRTGSIGPSMVCPRPISMPATPAAATG